jgi:hypothetical protein
MDKLKQIIMPSVFSAGASIIIYKYVLGEDLNDNVPFLGNIMPAYQVVAASSLIGSVAGEFLSDIVIPMVPKVGAIETIQDMVLPPAITGITTYGTLRLLVSEDTSFKNGFLLGAGSSVVGKYAYSMI